MPETSFEESVGKCSCRTLGALRANLWYARQLMSFLAAEAFKEYGHEGIVDVDVGVDRAGRHLACGHGEHARHPGYAGRSAIAVGIVLQGLATVLCLMWQGRSVFRAIVLAGAVAAAVLGASAIIGILNAPHFEGFVLLIGVVLMVQAMMALIVIRWRAHALS